MAERPNIIKNTTYNITENDVNDCDDLHTLRKYLIWVKKDIDIIQGKVKQEKAQKSTGQEIDEKRHESRKTALRIQQRLQQLIENRIDELMDNAQETYQLEVNFIEKAREAVQNEEMSGDLYELLLKRSQGYEEV